MRRYATVLLVGTALLGAPIVSAVEETPQVGIEERIGETIPLSEYSFIDENGEPVALAELFDRPVVLTLVYFRCAGICTPLLQELARLVEIGKSVPGEDYRIVTISFDPKDDHQLAAVKKKNMLASVEGKDVSPDGWRFLTGDEESIRRLTDAVGFRYTPDRNKIDFVHAGALIFLSSDGKITRYLNGTRFNPADMELALVDATEGRARSFMQRMQRICYSYDPEGRAYVLKINRIILGVTLGFALLFVAYLLTRGFTRRVVKTRITGTVS